MFVPGLETASVLVKPAGALTVRLLIVITAGVLVVAASMVTVLDTVLVRKTRLVLTGANPSDQFVPVSHLSLAVPIQLSMETARANDGNVVSSTTPKLVSQTWALSLMQLTFRTAMLT